MSERETDSQTSAGQRRRSVRLALYLAAFAVSIYVAYILLVVSNQGAGGG